MRWSALLLALAAGCSGQPAARPDLARRSDAVTLIRVQDGAGLLFSFFDFRAELRTVDLRTGVPEGARAEVQVTDPRRPLPGDFVYLADLRKPMKDGTFRTWVDRRGAWLDRVTPKVSQLPRPVLAAAPPPVKKVVKRIRRRPRPAQAGAARPRVILFSTSWCPSCKSARAHLTSRGVPFLELDVERDQQAGEHYQKVQAAYGLKQGVVPIILVDGKPLQGFSAPQLDAMLASAGLASRGP